MQTAITALQGRTDKAGFRVERQADGGHRLHVLGKLPLDWVGNLAGGLARNGLSITHGRVFREGAMSWHGHIALQSSAASSAPEAIDYHQLVRSEADRTAADVFIDSFVLRPTEEKGGALFLDIRGEDQTGFLGTFLGRLSFYSLFPVHLEIETSGGLIHDRFWLAGVGGGPPRETVVEALRRSLEKMVKRVS